MNKNILLFLLALMVAPAWAVDARAEVTSAAGSSEASTQPDQTAQKREAKKSKIKKHNIKNHKSKKIEAVTPTASVGCYRLTCGGVTQCFLKGCTGSCSGC